MKKLLLLGLAAGALITAPGCRKNKEKVVIVERDGDEYYDDYGRPVHNHSTTVKKDGQVVKYVQKPSKQDRGHYVQKGSSHQRTHVELD